MSYDNDFFDLYAEYLMEKTVRCQHDWVFDIIHGIERRLAVVDLGCGSGEFYDFYLKSTGCLFYLGLDTFRNKYFKETERKQHNLWDYREDYDNDRFKALFEEANAFVSLFSSEIMAPYEDNYRMYSWIFDNIPYVNYGIVSGFYYSNKKEKSLVEEAGGLVSYQTIEPVEDTRNLLPKDVLETRLILPVPSKLFGADVVEVWKIFRREEIG